jgi:hypothetical protein
MEAVASFSLTFIVLEIKWFKYIEFLERNADIACSTIDKTCGPKSKAELKNGRT